MVYQVNYEGYYSMSSHDREENALKRWFDNFKVDRNAWFATEFETLVVVEVNATAKHISKRQVCQIENPGYIKHKVQHMAGTREVVMDHTAPPAPMLTFAAKRIWQPPPPKSAEDLRKDAEYERMYRNGFEPRYIPRLDQQDTMRMAMMTMASLTIDKSILRQLEQIAPKHRRNV